MTLPRFRSRSKRRVAKKLPSGQVRIHYEDRKPKSAHCAGCGSKLHGVARATTAQLRKLSKTQKRPERAFGGVLCTKCMRKVLANQAREEHV